MATSRPDSAKSLQKEKELDGGHYSIINVHQNRKSEGDIQALDRAAVAFRTPLITVLGFVTRSMNF